VSFNRLNQHL